VQERGPLLVLELRQFGCDEDADLVAGLLFDDRQLAERTETLRAKIEELRGLIRDSVRWIETNDEARSKIRHGIEQAERLLESLRAEAGAA
jgi:hypothetical protein